MCVYLQDIETEENIKEEELDYRDVKEEITHSEFLPMSYLIPKVSHSFKDFSSLKLLKICNL